MNALYLQAIAQLTRLIEEAREAGHPEPSAMTLATVDADAHPSVRVVLLRGLDARGLVFYTRYTSAKGRDLEVHPYAAACFYWDRLDRQVRVAGPVEPVPPAESDAYWASRPRANQIAAWASHQSCPLASRDELETRYAEFTTRYAEAPIPRPERWGGYLIRPERIEFWEAIPGRLHHRMRYMKSPGGAWTRTLLNP